MIKIWNQNNLKECDKTKKPYKQQTSCDIYTYIYIYLLTILDTQLLRL